MIVNYNPPSLCTLEILKENLTPLIIKQWGVHFEKITITQCLYERVYNLYQRDGILWKSVYNGIYAEPVPADRELNIEEHYGLGFSITKRKGNNLAWEFKITQYAERYAHENRKGRFYCNEEQRGIVNELKREGRNASDFFDLACSIINDFKDEIISIDLWDNYESCRKFHYQKYLNIPVISRRTPGSEYR